MMRRSIMVVAWIEGLCLLGISKYEIYRGDGDCSGSLPASPAQHLDCTGVSLTQLSVEQDL